MQSLHMLLTTICNPKDLRFSLFYWNARGGRAFIFLFLKTGISILLILLDTEVYRVTASLPLREKPYTARNSNIFNYYCSLRAYPILCIEKQHSNWLKLD